MTSSRVICPLADLGDPDTREFVVPHAGQDLQLFLVRTGGQVYCYSNSCPHTGAPLNWEPDRFLDIDQRYIQCATHGALFRIEDGLCVQGPCAGQALAAVQAVVRDGAVVLQLP